MSTAVVLAATESPGCGGAGRPPRGWEEQEAPPRPLGPPGSPETRAPGQDLPLPGEDLPALGLELSLTSTRQQVAR